MKKALKKSLSMFFPSPPKSNPPISKRYISGPIGVTKISYSESMASVLSTAYAVGPKIDYCFEDNEMSTIENNMPRYNESISSERKSFESATAFKENVKEAGVVTLMQCIDDKDYMSAIEIGIEIIHRPNVSRYNLGIAHLGVAKAVLAQTKLPGKLGFDRAEVQYDVEQNLNFAVTNFRLVSIRSHGPDGFDKDEFNSYLAEATDMLNEIHRREAWKRGIVWQEPKNKLEGRPTDVDEN